MSKVAVVHNEADPDFEDGWRCGVHIALQVLEASAEDPSRPRKSNDAIRWAAAQVKEITETIHTLTAHID